MTITLSLDTKTCGGCLLPIFPSTRDGEPVWDLVYREYLETTTCYGTDDEFGTPHGHEPMGDSWTDSKGHTWTHDQAAQTWTRSNGNRTIVLAYTGKAIHPYKYRHSTASGVLIESMDFERLDPAAGFAHIAIR